MNKFLLSLISVTLAGALVSAQAAAPVVTSTPITSASQGNIYSYSLSATDVDNDALTWSAKNGTNLPSWLSLGTVVTGISVSTFAGSGGSGATDDIGTAASFRSPAGVAVDSNGTVYVADYSNHEIRKITLDRNVTTLAGSTTSGSANGIGTAASFYRPYGIAVNSNGIVYVSEYGNHMIRKITPDGNVTTLAGSTTYGSVDGIGTAASFRNPAGIAIDSSGNLYVADQSNHKIRKITPDGNVTTLAGSSSGYGDGNGAAAYFKAPSGVAVDSNGTVYVADSNNKRIRKITPDGNVTTFAGSGANGSTDGTGTTASFAYPNGITVDSVGTVYVSEYGNHMIRKITSTGVVTTLAGSGVSGFSNGISQQSVLFSHPYGVTTDSSDNLFVADYGNNAIRKILVTKATTLSGTPSSSDVGANDVNLTVTDGTNTVEQSFRITVVDTTPPTLSSATINTAGSVIKLTLNKDINTSSTLDSAKFAVNGASGASGWAASFGGGRDVNLTASTGKIYNIDTVTVSIATSSGIKDTSANAYTTVTNYPVTNSSSNYAFTWTLQAGKWNMTSVPDMNKTTEGSIASATGVNKAYKYDNTFGYSLLSSSSNTDINATTGLWIKATGSSGTTTVVVPSNSISTVSTANMQAFWKSNSSANTWYFYGMPQSLAFPAPTDSTILPTGCTLFNLWNYDAATTKWNDAATIPATSAVWFVCN